MAVRINCPVCGSELQRGYGTCKCGMYNLHFWRDQGGTLALYDRGAIWVWHDERPIWRLHYQRKAEDEDE